MASDIAHSLLGYLGIADLRLYWPASLQDPLVSTCPQLELQIPTGVSGFFMGSRYT